MPKAIAIPPSNSIVLDRGKTFPKICFHCGVKTWLFTRVEFETETLIAEGFEDGCLNVALAPIKFLFYGLILGPIGILLQYLFEPRRLAENQMAKIDKLVFKIPHCDDCKRLNSPNVILSAGVYFLVAHPDFRRAFAAHNKKS